MGRHTPWQRLVAKSNVSRMLTSQPVMSIKLKIENAPRIRTQKMIRTVETLVGTVTRNDGGCAECMLSEEEIYMEDICIRREDDEDPEEFRRNFPIGRKLEAQRTVSFLE